MIKIITKGMLEDANRKESEKKNAEKKQARHDIVSAITEGIVKGICESCEPKTQTVTSTIYTITTEYGETFSGHLNGTDNTMPIEKAFEQKLIDLLENKYNYILQRCPEFSNAIALHGMFGTLKGYVKVERGLSSTSVNIGLYGTRYRRLIKEIHCNCYKHIMTSTASREYDSFMDILFIDDAIREVMRDM